MTIPVMAACIPFLAVTVLAGAGLELPETIDTTAIASHTGFTLEYAEAYEQARWVAYTLTAEKPSGPFKRTDDFRPDPAITTGSAQLADYKGSGYDRGHLYPAADASWDSTSMSESFLMSNMTPQVPAFNRGVWLTLEKQVRGWATLFDTLFVATGGVLRPGLPSIGPDSVAVPELFYKVVVGKRGEEFNGIGFVIPNAGAASSVLSFAVTIDSVESLTGIDFFYQLPDSIEALVESAWEKARWFDRARARDSVTE